MQPLSPSHRDYLKLHFIILLWGFTSVLGELIELPATEIVFFRCLIATTTLAVILRLRLVILAGDALRLMMIGSLIGLHWVLFFLAVKISNVSVCMVGMATVSLWTAILEPWILPAAKFRRTDFVFGLLIIGAVIGIVGSETHHALGFAVSITSAFVAAVFSILNASFARRLEHRVVACYEMGGAFLFCGLCLPFSTWWLSEGAGVDLRPSLFDTFYLVVLAVVCTVYAYSEYVELLKRMSVFTINFANNLEPVYGMLMGALFFADYESLGPGFYIGSVAIALLVLLHTRLERRKPTAVN